MARYLKYLNWDTPKADVIDRIWKDSIDMHIHFAPDPGTVRRFDALETAVAAREAGMRAIVLKSDHIPTIQTAFAVQRAVPEVRVFGSINIEYCTTGGLGENTLSAIENSAKMGAKVVWFPTFDAAYAAKFLPGKAGTGITVLEETGQLKPVVYPILKLIREYNMVLCSGHLSYEETVLLFEAAKQQGITKLVATHPLSDVIWDPYTMKQILHLADMGAYIEHCYRNCMPMLGSLPLESYVSAIETIGAHRTILTTDFAQITDSTPAEGMRQFIASLLQMGVDEDRLVQMVRTNPAKLLDLS